MRNTKWFLLVVAFLLFFVSPLNQSVAKASTKPTLESDTGTGAGAAATNSIIISSASMAGFACGNPLISTEVEDAIDDYKKNDANMAEKFLTGQAQNFMHIGDLNGIATLVFGNPYCIWSNKITSSDTPVMSSNGIFTDEEMDKIVKPMVSLFGSAFSIMLTLALMIASLKVMMTSVKGRAFSEFWDTAGWWVIAILLALFYFDFVSILFQINAALVLSIRDLITSLNGDVLNGFSVMSSWKDFLNAGTMGSFLFVILAEWILAAILNIIYIARKVVILILIIMGIIAIYSLLFPRTRGFFTTWLKEIIGNIFLQSIHAIVFFGIIQFVELGAGVFFKLVLMMMFIPISGMISKWLNFGDSSSKMGSALTMVGLGGAVSTMMLASQASNIMRGGSYNTNNGMSSVLNGGFGGGNGGGNGGGGGGLTQLANSLVNDTSATSISARAAGSADSTLFNLTKGAGEKLGTFVGGVGGLVAGPAGSMAAAKIGRMVGGGIPQMARNATTGILGAGSAISGMKNYSGESGTGFKALFGKNSTSNFTDLNARRQMLSNVGESLGVVVGGQRGAALGRSLGAALSGASRQRLSELNSKGVASALGMESPDGALTFGQIAQRFPNADAKWVQTNQGSSFHVNTGDGFKQVGVTGAADGALKSGQARVMDFKLADAALDYKVQPNGTYKPDSDLLTAHVKDQQNYGAVSSISSDMPPAIGLQGSTQNALRTSNAYIVSGVESGNATAVANASSNATKVQDAQFKSQVVNPDAYIFQGVQGSPVSTSDRVASNVQAAGEVSSKWAEKIQRGVSLKNRKLS